MDEGKDKEQLERIQNFLVRNGTKIDVQPHARIVQLQKIDEILQIRLAKLNEAQKIERENSISILSISEASGISNKTFYNQVLLRKFVKFYAPNSSGEDRTITVKASEFENLKKRVDFLQKANDGLMRRDIDFELAKKEKNDLYNEIKDLTAQVHALEEQYGKSQTALESAQRVISDFSNSKENNMKK